MGTIPALLYIGTQVRFRPASDTDGPGATRPRQSHQGRRDQRRGAPPGPAEAVPRRLRPLDSPPAQERTARERARP